MFGKDKTHGNIPEEKKTYSCQSFFFAVDTWQIFPFARAAKLLVAALRRSVSFASVNMHGKVKRKDQLVALHFFLFSPIHCVVWFFLIFRTTKGSVNKAGIWSWKELCLDGKGVWLVYCTCLFLAREIGHRSRAAKVPFWKWIFSLSKSNRFPFCTESFILVQSSFATTFQWPILFSCCFSQHYWHARWIDHHHSPRNCTFHLTVRSRVIKHVQVQLTCV